MPAGGFDAPAEFDRQVARLLDKGYPAATGMTSGTFTQLVEPLRAEVGSLDPPMTPPTSAQAPFVLVISSRLLPPSKSMPLTDRSGQPGFVSPDTADVDRFEPISTVDVPAGDAYLLLDVERGEETRNVTPDDALVTITARGRTPLTVAEGIAWITAFPNSLEKNHCFSLLASRCGDRRVPALWISNRRPKLGWCWAGNPHTWLGSASCGGRVGGSQRSGQPRRSPEAR